jgi:hypothetical protein
VSTTPTKLSKRHTFGAFVAAGLLAATLTGGLAGTASAKEIGTGGTVTPTAPACSPVTSLGYKGDATTSETGLATVQVNYGVKACDKDPVVVDVEMFETANPAAVVWSDPNAPLAGKFTAVVRPALSYQVVVTVTNANTGVLEGSQTIFAAARYKPV